MVVNERAGRPTNGGHRFAVASMATSYYLASYLFWCTLSELDISAGYAPLEPG
jgi:hypothetical protein